MTSASPTSTTRAATPVVRRTAPAGGRSCRRVPMAPRTASTSGRLRSHFNAWDKWQLGWLNHADADRQHDRREEGQEGQYFNLGPAEYNSTAAQALIREPAGQEGHDRDRAAASRGPSTTSRVGQRPRQHDDQADHPRRRPDQPVVHGPLADRDVLGLRVPAGVDRRRRDVHQRQHVGVDDARRTPTARTSASASPGRPASRTCATTFGTPTAVNVTADLSAYANSDHPAAVPLLDGWGGRRRGLQLRRYRHHRSRRPTGRDRPGWTYDGFIRTTGTEVAFFPNYYIAEYRQYIGYDKALKLGPYNFTDPEGTGWSTSRTRTAC